MYNENENGAEELEASKRELATTQKELAKEKTRADEAEEELKNLTHKFQDELGRQSEKAEDNIKTLKTEFAEREKNYKHDLADKKALKIKMVMERKRPDTAEETVKYL
ncbi:hypothetical protein BU26DRAFT_565260 [Trematosphaeria pertusa]|uniref:Uncharacterized protein n=1 Tax=Trematosphaeria pertusa TaxID=390896 RepID=A0A6A6ICN8_9PLEO|nr:uncharacterized protein BU26DRAFT_565260 [Trematosphaeria pertusa]KAF2247828.1 hypothetical protein BU26DRAFT_565260 [Trematosphaeria pertusa]